MSFLNARALLPVLALLSLGACARATTSTGAASPTPANRPDPRVGLKAGLHNAEQSAWNVKVVSSTPSPEKFANAMNSDLAFTGNYVIQGNFNGVQIWDISSPSKPVLVTTLYCPVSQSDVSVYRNLLFVSAESYEGRTDCGVGNQQETVSKDRIRGIRIFDISDIRNPKYIHNVQTCRGSHTHTVLEDPRDRENVYVYISGSAPVRPEAELAGCINESPDKNPNSALFRIEVIKVPLADPTKAAIVSSPRIFTNLVAPPTHGASEADLAVAREAEKRGAFVANVFGEVMVLPVQFTKPLLDSIVKARNGSGTPTGADSAALRGAIQGLVDRFVNAQTGGASTGPRPGPNQCHDITVYPSLGLAGGACEGYGLLLDIRDPVNPRRIGAVSDSNFAYWHSATFNNDGSKVIFTDEWGGGTAAKCRALDKPEWGANAIFTIENGQMKFQSYYKIAAPQTNTENCVAHNGSLIPVPGRDIMVQAWYQGGISVFDFTDAKKPFEIAHFDRGPVDSTRMVAAGSWSVYWYNGHLISSEIARGLDIAELTPSEFLTQNEIDAAKTVHMSYFNPQGQPKLTWPPSFALARAYVDQLERSRCLAGTRVSAIRAALSSAESASGSARRDALTQVASQLDGDARGSCDAPKVGKLAEAVRNLANITP